MSSTEKTFEKTEHALISYDEEWLKSQADQVRQRFNSAIKDMIAAGEILLEVRQRIEYGKWATWLKAEVGITTRTAQNCMGAARLMINGLGPDWRDCDILASHRALYTLSGNTVPEEAQEQALQQMQQGAYLSEGMVKGIIDGVKRAAMKAQLLPHVSKDVADVVNTYDVDPAIIPTLAILEEEAPTEFYEIKATGVVYYGDEPVPLHDANSRDVEDYVEHVRFETRMSALGLQADRTVYQGIIDALTMSALDAPHILAHTEKPSLAAIVFSDKDSLGTIARSLERSGGKPLVVIAAVKGAGHSINPNGQVPDWLNEIMEKVANA